LRAKYVGLGSGAPQTDVLINPYVFATKAEKAATIIFMPLLYFKLLFFPHPLSSDYSFNQIPYRNFGDIEVWLSLLLHLAIIYCAIRLALKKHPLGFALGIYLGNLALVGNFFVAIGATMGERLIYHSSLGFAMAAAGGLTALLEKLRIGDRVKRSLLFAALMIITVLAGIKTVERNAEWKNDDTLFVKDAQTASRSVLANGNAGARYLDMADRHANKEVRAELLEKAIFHLTKALNFHPKYVNGHINVGLAQYKLGHSDQAKEHWDRARELYPKNPYLEACYSLLTSPLVSEGFRSGKEGNYDLAIHYFRKATEINPFDAELWYDLGGAYYYKKQTDRAYECWAQALKLNPDHEKAKNGLRALGSIKQ
jgi:tetratricopeptide (TPR) repeat protein